MIIVRSHIFMPQARTKPSAIEVPRISLSIMMRELAVTLYTSLHQNICQLDLNLNSINSKRKNPKFTRKSKMLTLRIVAVSSISDMNSVASFNTECPRLWYSPSAVDDCHTAASQGTHNSAIWTSSTIQPTERTHHSWCTTHHFVPPTAGEVPPSTLAFHCLQYNSTTSQLFFA